MPYTDPETGEITSEIDRAIIAWRMADDHAKQAQSQAEEARQQVLTVMRKYQLDHYDSPGGKVALITTTKANIVVPRKEFEAMLRQKGIYDRFCTTKFDLNAVKAYVRTSGDDLYGTVELEDTITPRFSGENETPF